MASAAAEPAGWSGTALVVRGREVLAERTAGLVDGPGPTPSRTTRYQAGSISKLVVAATALALVERGRLDLGQPVSRWLAHPPATWAAITLHQLLSHTSGLGHWADVPGLTGPLADPPPHDRLVELIADAPLVHGPGETWRYSGPGFVVAALVVEAAAGAAYGDVAAELVVEPAGLVSTTSGHFPVGDPDVAVGHHGGATVAVRAGFTRIPGTGDLWTTVDDLVRLHQALRSGAVLRPELAALLWTSHARLPVADASGDGPVVVEAYGYGTFLGRVAGHPASVHPGDNPGYRSLLAHLPDLDVDLAVLTDDDGPGVEAAVTELARSRPWG